MAFNKGDIVWVKSANRDPKKLRHPAVVWEYTDDESNFIGIMLTSAKPSKFFENISMEAGHFVEKMEVTYSNTHFVDQLFVKFQSWGPFHKAGALTTTGISFIENNLSQTEPMPFDHYILSC